MKLKRFLNSDEYILMRKLLNDANDNRNLIKAIFDTSIYSTDVELLKDIVDIIDKPYGNMMLCSVLYLFLKVVSPFTLLEGDELIYNKEPYIAATWRNSSLRVFYIKKLEYLNAIN
jgi:hypothetical protein